MSIAAPACGCLPCYRAPPGPSSWTPPAPSLAGGLRLQTPQQVVETALRVLERRNPPPSIAVGRMNRLVLSMTRLASRRRTVMMMGALSARLTQTADLLPLLGCGSNTARTTV